MLYEIAPPRRHAGGLHAFIAGLTPGTTLSGHRHEQPTMVVVLRGDLVVVEEAFSFNDLTGCVCLCPAGLTRSITAGSVGADCLIVTGEIDSPFSRHKIWNRVSPTLSL